METLLSESELSEITGVAVQTLRNWRCTRQGPPFYKLGRAVKYSPTAYSKWLETCLVVAA